MLEGYKRLWARTFDFSGSSNRGDYWWATLAKEIVAYSFLALSYAEEAFMAIYGLYCFAGIIPGLSLTVRRVRDAGKGWQLIFIILFNN